MGSRGRARRPFRRAPQRTQHGAALLVILIFLVLAVSAVLLRNVDPADLQASSDARTAEALAEAKEALVAWAVGNKAEVSGAPGMLPFPDRNGETSPYPNPSLGPYDGESDEVTTAGSINYALLIGRFPWQTGKQQAESTAMATDLVDGTGERLWYALSANLMAYPGPGAAPVNSMLLNLDPPPYPWLVVRGPDGTVISDRVAAVVLSPGVPLPGQSRAVPPAAPDPDQYLDAYAIAPGVTLANHDYDACPDDAGVCNSAAETGEDFVLAPATDDFNDRLIYLTIDELMAQVERRVLGVVAGALRGYAETYGRFPLLAPYAEPLALTPVLRGTAKSGTGGTTLGDTRTDFPAVGVQDGDLVWNVTDGSAGVVAVGSGNPLTTASLAGGAGNTFAEQDHYAVAVSARLGPAWAEGTAAASSTDRTLVDTSGQNFLVRGFSAGVVLENLDVQPNSGLVSRYAGSDTAAGIGGVIHSRAEGTEPVGVGQFRDTRPTFASPNRYRIRAAFGQATASGAALLEDSDQDFVALGVRADDAVHNLTDGAMGRVTGVGTPDGLADDSQLEVEWLLGGASNAFAVGDRYEIGRHAPHDGVRKGLLAFHDAGMPYATPMDADWDWSLGGPDMDELCSFASDDAAHRDDLLGAAQGVGGAYAVDDAVCRWLGPGLVDCVARISQATPAATPAGGSPAEVPCSLAAGETAASGTPDWTTSVTERRIELHLRLLGPGLHTQLDDLNGERLRHACINYGSDCTGAPVTGNGIDPGDLGGGQVGVAWVRITDYAGAGVVLGRAQVSLPTTVPFVTGSLRLNDMRLALLPENEVFSDHALPPWFFLQEWYRLVMVAVAADEMPGEDGDCDGACLSVGVDGAVTDDAVEAMVLMAGAAIRAEESGAGAVGPQDRAAGGDWPGGGGNDCPARASLCDYLEGENLETDVGVLKVYPAQANAPDTYSTGPRSPTFNDQLRVICRNVAGTAGSCR